MIRGAASRDAGYDRFGRTISQKWAGTSSTVDQFDYAYDYASNRLTRDIPTAVFAANALDQAYTYDGLDRLATAAQGTLAGGTIGGASWARYQWTLDQLGNWADYKSGSNTTWFVEQERDHNAVNELTDITATAGGTLADPAVSVLRSTQPEL